MSKKEAKKQSGAKKILNTVTTILVVIVVLATILLVGVRIFGIQPYAVLSGSMEPTYHTGSLIYVKEVPASEIEVGDPITFVMDENLTVATHRVVEIDAENQHFITKGDANEFKDAAPVHFNNLIGTPVFTVSKLGYITHYIQNPPGKYFAIAIAAIILLLAFLPGLFDEDEEKSGKNKKKKAKKNSSGDESASVDPDAGN